MHEINNSNNNNLININKDWLVGFTDGEGCFFIGVNKSEQMTGPDPMGRENFRFYLNFV